MRVALLAIALAACAADAPGSTNEPCVAGDVLLRDPTTGTCRLYESNACGGALAGAASPAYPSCEGACEGLGEAACRAHGGCVTAYARTGAGQTYEACWEMAMPFGFAPACETLSQLECLGRFDCASVHDAGQPYHCEVAPPVPLPRP